MDPNDQKTTGGVVMPHEPQPIPSQPASPITVVDSRQPEGPLQPSSVIRVGSADEARIPDMTHKSTSKSVAISKGRIAAIAGGVMLVGIVAAIIAMSI